MMTFARLTLAATLAGPMLLSLAAEGAEAAAGPQLAHTVFFTLKDRSAGSREAFVASCHKYLTGHQGVSFFAVGTIAEDVNEGEVSARDFDVSLHAVFASRADEAAYLKHPRHLQFVEANKPNFAKVRVFDTYLT
ncbi:MAG: Dabb family protein, partial [Planctomycetia bacterium]|nr:Dabb family protein [Planctomycetia bacterium]